MKRRADNDEGSKANKNAGLVEEEATKEEAEGEEE